MQFTQVLMGIVMHGYHSSVMHLTRALRRYSLMQGHHSFVVHLARVLRGGEGSVMQGPHSSVMHLTPVLLTQSS